MYLDRISATGSATKLIARDSLAAGCWELAMLDAGLFGDRPAWTSPPLTTWSDWLGSIWKRAADAGLPGSDPLPLSANQTRRLWQSVIDSSPESPALVSTRGPALWAGMARRTLLEHGIDPAQQGGSRWQGDAQVFLRWHREFEQRLRDRNWIDADAQLCRLARFAPEAIGHDLLLLDPWRAIPEFDSLATRWQAVGRVVDRLWPDGCQAEVAARVAADPVAELEQAADWAADLLERQPDARLAVVIADLDSRRHEVETLFGDRFGGLALRGRPIATIGIFGAALNVLRLLSPHGGFGNLGAWLRSPFFAPGTAGQRAALECRLRSEPRAARSFVESFHRHGLRALIARSLPDLAVQLDRAIRRLPLRATPTVWTEAWQDALGALQWEGFARPLPSALQQSWDAAWGTFSELTPITGALDAPGALAEIERLMAGQRIYEPGRRRGIELLSRVQDIGPGFAGAWIAGCSDQAWPEPPEKNPLIPWALRAAHGMPGTAPEQALRESRAVLERLRQRLPAIVFSCPARIGDQTQVPSPEIPGWTRGKTGNASRSRLLRRWGARAWETVADPAPPLDAERIPGGARTLDLQARNPAEAFCIARLGAEPLEAPVHGLDARLRGIFVHRILEHVYRPNAAAADAGLVDQAIDEVASKLLGPGDAAWRVQVAAESRRARRILTALIEQEAARAPFVIEAVEHRLTIAIRDRFIDCRIDRIDRLASGGLLLIDYKTGERPASGWFDPRPRSCQLPLYAQQSGEPVAGIVLIALGDTAIRHRSAGTGEAVLAGPARSFAPDEWQHQLVNWREQLGELVAEFAGGDVRIPADTEAFARGPLAPLLRVTDRGK